MLTRPELLGTHGMVASTHWLASAAGMSMLDAGGNAADAAVAAGLMLQVVEPHLNGPGGEVPILVQAPGDARPDVICGQGVAPAAATVERVRGMGLDAIPGSGLLAACVPGAFDAWMVLLRDRGTRRLRDVLLPAVERADRGLPVLPRIATAVAGMQRTFAEQWPTSAEVWLAAGRPPQEGTLHRNPLLAATYRRVVAEAESASRDRDGQIEAARDAWYRGFVAGAIDRFLAGADLPDALGGHHPGLLTGEDMARWRATVEPPVTAVHAGATVCKPQPWSQGPALLLALGLLDRLGVAGMEPGGAAWVHTITEVLKLALADRDSWFGDPNGGGVPIDLLLDPAYLDERAALVGPAASEVLRPGRPGGREPRLPWPDAPGGGDATRRLSAAEGEPTVDVGRDGRGDTCHLDVVDSAGMMVSATPSGGWLQSSPAIPGLGFCLGTRAQMFTLVEGLPSTLHPGHRPRTTLSPTLVLRDGVPFLAIGTPGGDQQDQWPLLALLRHLHGREGLQAAIEAPTFHTTHVPSSFHPHGRTPAGLVVEARHQPGVVDELRRRGHRVQVEGPWSLGRTCAVARDPDGLLHGAADPRGGSAYAIGH